MNSEKGRLDHVSAIRKYIEAIIDAEDMHSLIVEGPPGWGKTTSVENSLGLAKIEALHLGAYSTALNLYNFLAENSEAVILLDDCAGIFNDPIPLFQGSGRVSLASIGGNEMSQTWHRKGSRKSLKKQ